MVPEANDGIPKADHVTVFFASQTGNAESISRNIHEQAQERGFKSQHFVLNDFAKVDWAAEDCMVFVVSTTGDGDPPDNSTKFWRHLRKLKGTGLTKAKYAVLGLGDTNYDNFCNTAKRLDSKLQDLGASSFYARGLADDATGLEETVDPWIKNLWPALAHQVICSPDPHDLPQPHLTKEELQIVEKLAHAHDHTVGPQAPSSSKAAPAASTTTPPQVSTATPPAMTTTQTETTAAATEQVVKALEGLSVAGVETQKAAVEKATGYTINVDFSAMAQHTNLTALPRVPNANLKITQLPAGAAPSVKVESSTCSQLPSFVQAPTKLLQAKISRVECLTTTDALKRTLSVDFSFDDDVEYAPGDAFGIWAPNDEAMVRGVLAALEVPEADWDKPVKLEGDGIPSHLQPVQAASLLDILRYSVDLATAPKKANIRMYGDYASDVNDKQRLMFMASKQGAEVFNAFRSQGPTLLDILHTFPSIKKIPLARLIETLPPHQPRYYSITNSPMARHGHRRMSCAFNVVEYELPEGKKRQGVCTPWLDRLAGQVAVGQVLEGNAIPSHPKVELFLKPSETKFNLPQDTSKPVIMIGPGTGVAPFMGFLEHRAEQRRMKKRLMTIWTGASRQQHLEDQFGEMWLFYGCRHRAKDWLFRRQMEEYQEEGVLSELFVAVSREEVKADEVPEERSGKYVQDIIKKQGERIWRLLSKKGALIYVCGDAKGMAKGVHDELVNILVEFGGMDKMAAFAELNKWAQEKRYLRDLWA